MQEVGVSTKRVCYQTGLHNFVFLFHHLAHATLGSFPICWLSHVFSYIWPPYIGCSLLRIHKINTRNSCKGRKNMLGNKKKKIFNNLWKILFVSFFCKIPSPCSIVLVHHYNYPIFVHSQFFNLYFQTGAGYITEFTLWLGFPVTYGLLVHQPCFTSF